MGYNNMKKKLLSIFAIAAVFAACNTIDDAPVVPSDNAKELIINATIDAPSTKLSYTEKEDGGYKATFSENDALWVYFHDASGAVIGTPTKLLIDFRTVSADGKSASFALPVVKIPEDASKLVAYLTTPNVTIDEKLVTVNLSNQANLAASLNNQIICATEAMADIAGKDANTIVVNLKLGYKTSLLKFDLALPDGSKIDVSKTTVKLIADDLTSKVCLVAGDACDQSVKGEIVAKAISADGLKVTAAMSVWAADNLTGKIVVLCNDSEYSVDFTPAKSLEAGNVYTVARELKNTSTIKKWVNDDAGSIDFGGGSVAVSNEFLSYENGKLSWTPNETGAPRSATISFESGTRVVITQLAPADFKASWTLVAKAFANSGAAIAAADPATVALEPVAARVSTPLTAADGVEYTNTFGLTGLCGSAVLDVCAVVDYENQVAKIGLFLDTREGAGQEVNGKLVVFYPGLATISATAWGKPWLFAIPEQGNPDYSYIWFTAKEDLKTFVYKNRTSADIPLQILTQYSDASINAVIGFGVGITSDSTIGAGSFSTYSNFFQINPSGYDGMTLIKK